MVGDDKLGNVVFYDADVRDRITICVDLGNAGTPTPRGSDSTLDRIITTFDLFKLWTQTLLLT